MDSLMLGVMAAHFKVYFGKAWRNYSKPGLVLGIVGIALVRLSMYPSNKTLVAPIWALTLISLSLSFILPTFEAWEGVSFPGRGFIGWISACSYPLYLCHPLVQFAVVRVFGAKAGYPVQAFQLIAALGLSFCFAFLVHVGIEKPVLRFRDRRFSEDLRNRSALSRSSGEQRAA